MTTPVPPWLREYTMTFSKPQVTITASQPMEKGCIGTLTTMVSHPCYASTSITYEIWAIEDSTDRYDSSRYTRRIILGHIGTNEILQGFLPSTSCIQPPCIGKSSRHITFRHSCSGRTLWCMNCWTDDMYESGMGGVGVPPFILYHSFNPSGFLRNLRNCIHCRSHFTIADSMSIDKTGATVFLPLQRKELDDAIEVALQSAGIAGSIRRERLHKDSMNLEQRREILAAALHPDRIMGIHTRTGLDVWEVLENM